MPPANPLTGVGACPASEEFPHPPLILAGKAGSHTRRKSPANQQLFLKLKTENSP